MIQTISPKRFPHEARTLHRVGKPFDHGGLTIGSLNPDKKLVGACGELSLSTWTGEGHFPFWGDRLNVRFIVNANRPSEEQREVLSCLISQTASFRDVIEQAILRHYQTEVFSAAAED